MGFLDYSAKWPVRILCCTALDRNALLYGSYCHLGNQLSMLRQPAMDSLCILIEPYPLPLLWPGLLCYHHMGTVDYDAAAV